MNERLKKIEARARALGWEFQTCHKGKYEDGEAMEPLPMDYMLPDAVDAIDFFTLNQGKNFRWAKRFHISFHPLNETTLEAAERLLSLHEPGLTVKVKQVISPLRCHEDCDLFLQGRIGCVMGWCDEYHMPNSDCREGTFKLVEVEDE